MAKKLRQAIASREEPSVFASIKIKDLPKDIRAKHMARKKKIDKLDEQRSKLFREGEKDIESLVKRIKDGK